MASISLPTPGSKPWNLNTAITAINNQVDDIQDLIDTGGVGVSDAGVNEILSNPETSSSQTVTAQIESEVDSKLGGGLEGLVRVEKGTLTNLNTPRPSWVGVVEWWIPEGSNPPLNIQGGDVKVEVATEAYVPPTPLEIFGADLLAWWDHYTSPPANNADYGTITDRAAVPHNMAPLTTGMTDVPQYDADGINGQPAVYQPPISSMGASGFSWGTGALTVIGGVVLGTADGTAQYVWNGQNSGTAQFSLATNSAGTDWLIRRGGTVRTAMPIQGSRTAPHAMIVTYNGDSSYAWDNGVKSSVIATPGTVSPTAFKMGLQQDIATPTGMAPGARFIPPFVVNRTITDAEAALATAFVRSRMGV